MADESEQMQVEEQEKPEAKAKKPERDPVAELKSVKDREVAEARKQAKAFERDLAETRRALDEQQAYVALLKERGELTDDEEARAKALAKREASLSEREKRAAGIERTLTVKLLAEKYGVPADVIEDYDDPRDMQIAALEYAISQRETAVEKPQAEAKPVAEEKEEAQDEGLHLDLGGGGRRRVDINSIPLGDPKWAEIDAQMKRSARV